MVKKLIVIYLLSYCTFEVFTQTEKAQKKLVLKNASVHLGFVYTKTVSEWFGGGNLNWNIYLNKKFSLGFSATFTGKKTNQNFGLIIQKPVIYSNEFALVSQYDIWQTSKFVVGLNLNNGLFASELSDKAIQVQNTTTTTIDTRPKLIARNLMYLLQPGIDIYWRIAYIKNFGGLYINPKIKYRFALGNPEFGRKNDFYGPYFGLGLTFSDF